MTAKEHSVQGEIHTHQDPCGEGHERSPVSFANSSQGGMGHTVNGTCTVIYMDENEMES